MNVVRINHRAAASGAGILPFGGMCAAEDADVAVLTVGIKVDRVGETAQICDAVALVIVLIKSVFLFKADAAEFSFVGAHAESRVDTEVALPPEYAVGAWRIAARVLVGLHGADEGTLGDEFPQAEDENSRHYRNSNPKCHFPADDLSLGRVGLVILIIGVRAENKQCYPYGKADRPRDRGTPNKQAKIPILLRNTRHSDHSLQNLKN